ncbi:MAG: hypothetical protein LUG27_01000 [Clostridiales bacterium]|nr:hypothetical protein [Clostridiales bacterium]
MPSIFDRIKTKRSTSTKVASSASRRFSRAAGVDTGAIWKKISAMPAGK